MRREPLSENLRCRMSDKRRGDTMTVRRVRAQQCSIADYVDDTRYSSRETVYFGQCHRRKDIPRCTCHPQSMSDIRGRFRSCQWVEVVSSSDTLCELPQLVPRQQLAQLRLADENDLQKLARVGF